MRLAILGGGSMGEAFARSLLYKKVLSPSDLQIVEVSSEKAAKLRDVFGCEVNAAADQLSTYDLVLIAVKPQEFSALAQQISDKLTSTQILISVMAGVPMRRIAEETGASKIVRCMPNLPVVIGDGVIACVAAPEVNYDEFVKCERVLASGGSVVKLDNESMIDAVTALSASGPGYFFYALEELIKVSEELGLRAELARPLIFGTIRGSLSMAEHEPHSLATLRAAVTSKGGTTAAGLHCFEELKMWDALKEGIRRACTRAKELGAK